MTDGLLVAQHLVKRFVVGRLGRRRTIDAVNDVSFTINAGETLGLVGESGSGKSTVGRLVLRLVDATSGSVHFDGRDVLTASTRDLRLLRRDMQVVFQDPYGSLSPRMRVGRLLAEPFRIHGLLDAGDRRRRILEALDEVGLHERHMSLYPHQFSGGQRQRIAIARALVLRPKLIVGDEPVSALDVSVQAQVLNLMRDLQHHHGIAYLFISHDLSVVRFMSHRIAVMYLGEFVEVGLADEVYHRPQHPYTMMLIESIPGRATKVISTNGSGADADSLDANPPPGGCAFQPRCRFARERCKAERPLLREVRPGHFVACHYAEELIPLTGNEAVSRIGLGSGSPGGGTKAATVLVGGDSDV